MAAPEPLCADCSDKGSCVICLFLSERRECSHIVAIEAELLLTQDDAVGSRGATIVRVIREVLICVAVIRVKCG